MSKKARNSLFPQCNTLMGIKSSSVEDRVVKFACVVGFLAEADRVV